MTAIEIYKLLKSQAEGVADITDVNAFVNKNYDKDNTFEITYIQITGSHLFLELLSEVLIEKDDEIIKAVQKKVAKKVADAKLAARAEADTLLG
jgi:E3 ubiquitin-protein ligase DOA10